MVHFGEDHEPSSTMPPVVILCGGRGERLGGLTVERPKPMVEIGGKPILWHIMRHFQHYGCEDFILALGYLGWVVEYYFKEQDGFNGHVRCIPTGWDTQNGGRIKRLSGHLYRTFFMAWCDGVSDIDLENMLTFHRKHGKLCTVAAVHPPSRFGEMVINGSQVQTFVEKPTNVGWINGGFFICEPGVLEYIGGDLSPDKVQWERTPMERLAKDGQLMAYKHTGFWRCMDTDKDQRELEEMWRYRGNAPWKIWRD